eukprot:TRINITY_DN70059_c0_g1_i1.p1 TRINITY_DN70059_c0_g1~~TRINITY_DN70059_c0_g1_i1.p1  ORF type:complete len:455 (+),score=38.61 TRINITY_DN70059_c0_g1_i1:102-1367(+)
MSAFKLVLRWAPTVLPLLMWDVIFVLLVAGIMIAIAEIFDNSKELEAIGRVFEAVTTLLAPAYAIFSAFATSITYGRWWGQRGLLQGLIGNTREASMQTSVYLRNKKAKTECSRYLSAAFAWAIWQIRQVHKEDPVILDGCPQDGFKNVEEFHDWLKTKELLTADELETIKKVNTPFQACYQWVLQVVADEQDNGQVRNIPCSTVSIQKSVSGARGSASGIIMYLTTPFPFPYYHLIRLVGVFLLLVLGVGAFYAWKFDESSDDEDEDSASFITAPVPFLTATLQAAAYSSAFHLMKAMANPFGVDVCDFPLEKQWLATHNNINQNIMLSEQKSCFARPSMSSSKAPPPAPPGSTNSTIDIPNPVGATNPNNYLPAPPSPVGFDDGEKFDLFGTGLGKDQTANYAEAYNPSLMFTTPSPTP